MFYACGRIRTGNKVPVLKAYFPVLAYGILGKSGLFVAPPLEDCLTGPTGSSTQAGTGCTELQLISSSVANGYIGLYIVVKRSHSKKTIFPACHAFVFWVTHQLRKKPEQRIFASQIPLHDAFLRHCVTNTKYVHYT